MKTRYAEAIDTLVDFECEYYRLSGMVDAAVATNQPALADEYAAERRKNADAQSQYESFVYDTFDGWDAMQIINRARIIAHRGITA